jgi:Icc-related predicted phosphoesterase
MRLVIFSDLHDLEIRRPKRLPPVELSLPECDLALFCGDACNWGTWNEWVRFCRWYGRQKATFKLAIGGNHDNPLLYAKRAWAVIEAQKNSITYLQDSSTEVLGLSIYGSPWTPYFGGTEVFHHPAGSAELRAVWARVPASTDILLTHGPALGLLDSTSEDGHLGDELLLEAIDRVQPRLHAFGHVHDSYGALQHGPTLVVNASLVDSGYNLVHSPVVLDL